MDASEPGPMVSLRQLLPLPLAAAAVLSGGAGLAADPYVPFPSEESLKELQLITISCARDNSAASCSRSRELADPLMDHPRLPAACKDAVWELLQVATPAASNSFQRRDAIDQPARRLTVVCADPVKLEPSAPKPGSLNPSQT